MAAVSPRGLPALVGAPLGRGMRIGLLGGSFNPAHEGHLHISLEALRRLQLDQVWWLVSPQNPLKPQKGMAAFDKRLASAQAMAQHPAIHVTGIETQLGTQYTFETISALMEMGPDLHFVWLMGADNLSQLPTWKNWEQLMQSVPVGVLARPGFNSAATSSKAALRFAQDRIPEEDAARLATLAPPAWVFLPIPLHSASSTQIRDQGKW